MRRIENDSTGCDLNSDKSISLLQQGNALIGIQIKPRRIENDSTGCDLNSDKSISLLQQVTPLARQVNCLDIDRIAEVCVENIPKMVGAKFASLYILDETNNILHLHKHNHPYLINKIVSLNQNPPTPMVMAVRSK